LAVCNIFRWHKVFDGDCHWIPPILFETVRMIDGMPGTGAAAGTERSSTLRLLVENIQPKHQ
jgi:hypothetical protein